MNLNNIVNFCYRIINNYSRFSLIKIIIINYYFINIFLFLILGFIINIIIYISK